MLGQGGWDLQPGQSIKRTELHERYGGRRQGGIAPSTRSPNVMIFTAPSGHRYGYFDGWHEEDGCFHYTGEGQTDDQQLKQGNRALFEHAQTNKSVRLFSGASDKVTYVGEFEVDPAEPYYRTDAPDLEGAMRQVIVFRLRPVGDYNPDLLPIAEEALQKQAASVNELEPENRAVERFMSSAVEERIAERREAALIDAYLEFRRASALPRLRRLKIKPTGEVQPLFTDLYDPATKMIIEAKGTVTREATRMAVGQLLDYSRFVDQPKLAILVPELPRQDLLDFLDSNTIAVIAPRPDGLFDIVAPKRWPKAA